MEYHNGVDDDHKKELAHRVHELRSFDETKSGVKGVVDSGMTKVPSIFIQPLEARPSQPSITTTIPTIDLMMITTTTPTITDPATSRTNIINQILEASEQWGFFQVVNHGIPISLLNNTLQSLRSFYEQDNEVKKQYYTRDLTQRFIYTCNFNLYGSGKKAADWRDTIRLMVKPNPPPTESLPELCREMLEEYPKQVMKLGSILFELISEGLGLESNHLKEIGCEDGLMVLGHYYPACPQPELVFGIPKHTDNDFLTVLLQDDVGGLQILHDEQWIDVHPIPGALVINVGDLLQLISNDKFKSVEHQVLTTHARPRVSVACFFATGLDPTGKAYGPIKELLSEHNPARYQETTIRDYYLYSSVNKGHNDGTSALLHLRKN